jgi:hypothetical protein
VDDVGSIEKDPLPAKGEGRVRVTHNFIFDRF